ncbi:hypothetical protein D3C76_1745400 [compost metagenome]
MSGGGLQLSCVSQTGSPSANWVATQRLARLSQTRYGESSLGRDNPDTFNSSSDASRWANTSA